MAEVLIVANPIAGRGRGATIARRLVQRLEHDGHGVRAVVESADPAELAKVCAAEPRLRAVVVIGGDGTLRSVASGLIDACRDDAPPLLVVPMGTANLMGRHLGIAWNRRTVEEQVAAAIDQNRVVHLDVATANERLFLLMAGVGLDAQVVHELERMRRGPIGLLSYAAPAIKAAVAYRYAPLWVDVDGKRVFGPRPGLAFVGNVAEYGTGFPILPYARADDGLLDVCVLPCRSRWEALHLLLHAVVGQHLGLEGVVYTKGKMVEIESAAAVPVQLDGDAAGFTPLQIRLLDVRMRFLVPAR